MRCLALVSGTIGAMVACPPGLLAADGRSVALGVPRATSSIVIDGSLDEAAWEHAARIDHFYEISPGNNVPPKVRTVAYLTYDSRYLYVGVVCDDPTPAAIRAPYVPRDQVLGDQDNIAVMLDTRNDERTDVELRVNARGIQTDAVSDDAINNEDFSPDFFYETAAKITARGWTAEFAIPFSTLRYPATSTRSASSSSATTRAASVTRSPRARSPAGPTASCVTR